MKLNAITKSVKQKQKSWTTAGVVPYTSTDSYPQGNESYPQGARAFFLDLVKYILVTISL